MTYQDLVILSNHLPEDLSTLDGRVGLSRLRRAIKDDLQDYAQEMSRIASGDELDAFDKEQRKELQKLLEMDVDVTREELPKLPVVEGDDLSLQQIDVLDDLNLLEL